MLIHLLLLLLGGSVQLSAESLQKSSEAEIQQTQDFDFESTWPSGQAVLFSSPASGESGFNFRDRLPESNTEEDRKSLDSSSWLNTFRSTPDSIYFEFSELIDGSQTIKKLLFPFHSFL
ncbi:MAG: hypothetical protein RID02_06630 [Gracilimonas sp.]